MCGRTLICVCLFGLILVKCDAGNSGSSGSAGSPGSFGKKEINFSISSSQTEFTCDHTLHKRIPYTVLEDDILTINIVFSNYPDVSSDISSTRCTQINNNITNIEGFRNSSMSVKILPRMGTIWDCKIKAFVHQNGRNNSKETNCYMQVHVKRSRMSQMILINNVVSDPVRTDLSEKDIDFKVEYEYADNDVVEVMCMKVDKEFNSLSLEYHSTEKPKGYKTLCSDQDGASVGIRIRLNSVHDSSWITCKWTGTDDFTKTQVIFVMQTRFDSSLNVFVNGLNLRPKYQDGLHFRKSCISLNLAFKEKMHLRCETKGYDLELREENKRIPPESKINDIMTADVAFELTHINQQKLMINCSAFLRVPPSSLVEKIEMNLIPLQNLTDYCQLNVEMPKNNIVMEQFELQKIRIIYYEFEDSDNVTISCSTTCTQPPVNVRMKIRDKFIDGNSSQITKNLILNNHYVYPEHACYLYEISNNGIIRETRIIFLKKIWTTISDTTAAPEISITPTELSKDRITAAIAPTDASTHTTNPGIPIWVWIVAVTMTCIIVVCITSVIYKMKKRTVPREGREFSNHEFPPEWENYYISTMDRKRNDATYSEPYSHHVYAINSSKNDTKNYENVEQTYASIDINTNQLQDDPNYAEIGKNIEANYTQVLPKDQRNKTINPELLEKKLYANIGQEEATYCEPNVVGQKSEYGNVVNNTKYVNKTGDVEYAEPAYCEANTKIN